MIEQINHIAGLWWSGAIAMFWQVGVLILLIGCVDLIIRRWAWPQLRYALWLMVLVKLVLPPTIYLSTSVTSRLQPLARQIVAKEIQRENLETTTSMILANLKTAAAESSVEAVSSRDTVTERHPALVFTSSENVAGESLNAAYVKPIWQAYVMAVWLAGMFILGGWLVLKLLHLRKEDHQFARTASLPESFYNSIARCAKSLGLRQVPKVVLTRRVACPAVFGMIRPVLLMPVGYLSNMTRRDTEHMLLHELAHIKRGDLWVHGFYMLLQVVYWYNPLLWLVRSQMHHLRELCCDATVARVLKERISEYRQTLIDVARRFLTKPTEPGLGLLGLFEDSNRLLVRLNWLKKETWRYQKMKKLTIVTTIVLMLAFVLPMAQAQDKPATEPSSSDSVKAEERLSHSENTAEVEQKLKENQEQLSPNLQELEVQLQQLQIQKQKLEKELQAMARAKQAEAQAAQATIKAKEAKLKAKDVKNKAAKASKEAEKVKNKAAKAKASADAHKAEVDAKHLEQWAKEMEAWAKQYEAQMNSPEVQEKIHSIANNSAQQWVNSDEFKQWQKDMQQWSKEFAEAHKEYAKAHEEADSGDHDHASDAEPHPMPAMPVMPTMPAMPAMPANIVTPNVAAPVPPQPPMVVVPKVKPHTTGTATVTSPAQIARPAPVLPKTTGNKRNIEIKKDKEGKYIATTEMQFVSKVQPGKPLVVRNSLGNIILKPSKDRTCNVRAVIRGKAETEAEARAIVEQVGMNVNSSDERYYIKPVKQDGDKWNNLNVDFYITVPSGVLPDVKTDLGNIELSDLKGDIKAVTNLGNVKAVNTSGNVNLRTNLGKVKFIAPKEIAGGDVTLVTNLGDIEFTASRDLSAKFQVETKMGEIKSELPLEIDRSDMFKRTAQGTISTGGATIKMTTDMGKINLKWQSPSQDEVKF